MSDPEPTKAHNPESPTRSDETVDAAHPSDDQLALFVAGRLESTESQAVQTHVAGCTSCVTRMNVLSGSIASFVADFQENSAHAPPSSDPNATVDRASATTPNVAGDHSDTGTFGDYELIDEIARGGMGVVYRARQKTLNRIVALKMIKSGEFANQEQVDRFYKEAEAAANLDHPGIVPVYEVGEINGQHYFTMGFVDGDSLSDRLRDGPLPLPHLRSVRRLANDEHARAS